MIIKSFISRAASLSFAAILTLGCDASAPLTSPLTPIPGEVKVTVWTTTPRSGVDADGYTLSIDSGPPQAIDINATITLGDLHSGRHLIALEGIASNCSVRDTNQRWVDVKPNQILLIVSFDVTCIGDPSGAGDWDY